MIGLKYGVTVQRFEDCDSIIRVDNPDDEGRKFTGYDVPCMCLLCAYCAKNVWKNFMRKCLFSETYSIVRWILTDVSDERIASCGSAMLPHLDE